VASGRGRAHPGPVREEKEVPAGSDRDQGVVVEGLDLASRRSDLLDSGHAFIGS